jgi:hypothetical protein
MKLNPEQEKLIYDYVEGQGLEIQTLRDDLVDHLCCVVETKLGKGQSFEQLLNDAVNELSPNGLEEIQEQTIFLLNSKRIIIMKKVLFLTGFLGSVSLTVGATLKIMHLPMANILFMIGFLTILLIFIPLLAIDRYKVSLSKSVSVKTKIIMGATAGIITGLSGIFKIMHLQGANVLLVLGAFIFAFGFLPFYFFTMYKKSVS